MAHIRASYPLVVADEDGPRSSATPPSRRTGRARPTRRQSRTPSTSPVPTGATASARHYSRADTRRRMHGFHSVIARIVGDHEAWITPPPGAADSSSSGPSMRSGRKFGRWLDVDLLMQLLLSAANEEV